MLSIPVLGLPARKTCGRLVYMSMQSIISSADLWLTSKEILAHPDTLSSRTLILNLLEEGRN